MSILKDELEARNKLRQFIKKHYPDWKKDFDLVEEEKEMEKIIS